MIDKNLIYSEDQAITADAESTNVVKHGNIGVGRGQKMNLIIQVTEDFATLTSLTIKLQQDADAAFSDAVDVVSKSILLADLVAGAQFNLGEPEITTPETEIYSRMYYDVVGSNPTAGKINAFWQLDPQEAVAPEDQGLTSGYPTY